MSGEGFLGIEGYCRKHRPSVLILENVMRLFSRTKVEGGTSAYLVTIVPSIVYIIIFDIIIYNHIL